MRRCRCGVPVTSKDHGVCKRCDARNIETVLLLALFLREHHYAAEADFLARIVNGHVLLRGRRAA